MKLIMTLEVKKEDALAVRMELDNWYLNLKNSKIISIGFEEEGK